MTDYRAFGKFLMTGEYLVLHGANALALPLTKKYQTLKVSTAATLNWQAFDENNHLWLKFPEQSNELLDSILSYIKKEKPHLFESGLNFETRMNFSPAWGLGSSSTFVSLLSQWSGVDAHQLQKLFFKGSGYDVAAATQTSAFTYELKHNQPVITPVSWNPSFKDQLRFVYLGKKQDSREAMASFKAKVQTPDEKMIQTMNQLTNQFIQATSLSEFSKLMIEHETFIGQLLNVTPVKAQLFSDFPGAVKSLGGWGGDFVMSASETDADEYFKARGYNLIFKWSDLIR